MVEPETRNKQFQQIKRIKEGDIKAFDDLFTEYYQQLVQFSYRYLQDVQLGEDVVQDVYFNVWKNRLNLDPNSNIKSYLFTAVRNHSIDKIRKNNIKKEYAAKHIFIETEEQTAEDIVNTKEFETAINDLIRKLPEKSRIIFCMNRFDRLTYSEIAQVQGISVKTVETHMLRSLKFLRSRLSHLKKAFLMLF